MGPPLQHGGALSESAADRPSNLAGQPVQRASNRRARQSAEPPLVVPDDPDAAVAAGGGRDRCGEADAGNAVRERTGSEV